MTQYGEWKIHNGGECPVDGGRVQVQRFWETRIEVESYESFSPKFADWPNVICYREVIEPKRETVTITGLINKSGVAFSTYYHGDETAEITVDLVDGKPDWSTLKGRDL